MTIRAQKGNLCYQWDIVIYSSIIIHILSRTRCFIPNNPTKSLLRLFKFKTVYFFYASFGKSKLRYHQWIESEWLFLHAYYYFCPFRRTMRTKPRYGTVIYSTMPKEWVPGGKDVMHWPTSWLMEWGCVLNECVHDLNIN